MNWWSVMPYGCVYAGRPLAGTSGGARAVSSRICGGSARHWIPEAPPHRRSNVAYQRAVRGKVLTTMAVNGARHPVDAKYTA